MSLHKFHMLLSKEMELELLEVLLEFDFYVTLVLGMEMPLINKVN